MTKLIPLTRGLHAIVDDEDYEWLIQWKWCCKTSNKGGTRPYAVRTKKNILMHRIIINAPDGLLVDHINGETLDNRRCNLRLANNSQNVWNQRTQQNRKNKTSQFKGVSWDKKGRIWRPRIRIKQNVILLGSFDSETDAALAYDTAARAHFGEFAKLNFPDHTPADPIVK